jgi:isocitrate dehydrogenase (NAD+)
MTYRVVVLPGDGIGPEVVAAACEVLEATNVGFEWQTYRVGTAAVDAGEPPLSDEVVAAIEGSDAAFKGPVSTPIGRVGFRSVNVALRRAIGVFAQVRPSRTFPGIPTPFDDVDLVVIRDTTEDLYAGIEFAPGSPEVAGVTALASFAGRDDQPSIPPEAGISVKFTSETASRRVVEFAFEYARRHGRRKVTALHKASVMRATDGVFLGAARDVAGSYPDIEFEDQLIDNAVARLVQRPTDFDVMVMSNFYGDIVSDLTAGLTGGIGLAGGANYGAAQALFEPAHGTAPKHGGRNVANPVAAILSGAMMLRHLGESGAADRVERAVGDVLRAGDVLTYDLRRARPGPRPASTSELAKEVARHLDP